MANKKLTPQQSGRLGGLAAARSLGPDGVRARGEKAAETLQERYGKEHFVRMAHRRWGRKVSLPAERKEGLPTRFS